VQLPQLKRIRWAVRATLMLGVAASVAANILHADNNPISQAISAWPPLALLLTVELTSRIPMHKKGLAALRIIATGVIAGIAAWVSYWHMQGVALFYGEETGSSYLLPVSVDGLIVVASVSLVELAGRIRVIEEKPATSPAAAVAPPAPVQFVQPMPIAAPAATPVFQPAQTAPPRSAPAVVEEDDYTADEALTDLSSAPVSPAVGPGPRTAPAPVSPAVATTARAAQPYVNGSVARAAVSAPARTVVTAAAESNTPRQRRPVQETAELAAEIESMHPGISSAELARRLGISEVRLRAIRREAALAPTSD
jgi:hypothetical protein